MSEILEVDLLRFEKVTAQQRRAVAALGHTGERYSVVQFSHPTPRALLNPPASRNIAENPQRFSGMVSADARSLVLYEIDLVETARRVS